jgi:hypothetical protein
VRLGGNPQTRYAADDVCDRRPASVEIRAGRLGIGGVSDEEGNSVDLTPCSPCINLVKEPHLENHKALVTAAVLGFGIVSHAQNPTTGSPSSIDSFRSRR